MAPEEITFTTVSEAQPTPQQLADIKFAWRAVKHVKVGEMCGNVRGREMCVDCMWEK